MSAKAKKFPQFLAAVCICIGAMGTGTVIAWTSNISDRLQKDKELNDVNFQLEYVGSIMCAGATCVCIPIGILANAIGRKYSVLLTIIPFIVGWVLIIFAQNLAMMLVGRFLTGMGGGAFCILGPLYTSEVAQKEIRGTLGTFIQLFITIGILCSNILGWLAEIKIFCYICAALPVIFGLLLLFLPESPIYLIKKKKKEKATKAFARLRGKDYDASAEIEEAEKQVARDEELKAQYKEQLKSIQGKKSTLICFLLMIFQQLSGVNAIIFYTGKIFIDAESSIDPELCVVIVGGVQVIVTIFAGCLVGVVRRRVLLMVSAGVMTVSTLLIAVYFLLKEEEMVSSDTVKSLGWLPLISLVLFIIAFPIGIGPIPWLVSAETFPPAIMTKMSSYAGTFNWFLALLVTLGYGLCADNLSSYLIFFLFTFVSATAVLIVWLIIPETKGKSFQQIQKELGT